MLVTEETVVAGGARAHLGASSIKAGRGREGPGHGEGLQTF